MAVTLSSERLPIELVCSALNFLSRPQLFRLSSVSYRLHTIHAGYFTSKPYLYLKWLSKLQSWRINETETINWSINEDTNKNVPFLELLAKSKFIRFNKTWLLLSSVRNEAEHMKEISHACQNGYLIIQYDDETETLQQTIMPLISNCRCLDLEGPQAIQWFQHIPPSDNLQNVRIIDHDRSEDNSVDFCLEGIVEFLFRSMNDQKSRMLIISTELNNQSTQTIINTVEKKFLESTAPVAFSFHWKIPYSTIITQTYRPELSYTNQSTKQELRLRTKDFTYVLHAK
ncbi:hypothetical protein Ddc_10849 [Ditylenchus destructor]|nr:hypothetical protein Ddc_10849 [Ditylenchus destructor]